MEKIDHSQGFTHHDKYRGKDDSAHITSFPHGELSARNSPLGFIFQLFFLWGALNTPNSLGPPLNSYSRDQFFNNKKLTDWMDEEEGEDD